MRGGGERDCLMKGDRVPVHAADRNPSARAPFEAVFTRVAEIERPLENRHAGPFSIGCKTRRQKR